MHFKQKVLSLFVGKGRNGCQNSILRVQIINFHVKNSKYPQMFLFLVLTAKNSLRKLFGRLVKSVLVCTTLSILRKIVYWSFVFFSGILNKNFVPFDKRNWAKLSKLLFLSPKDHLSCFKNLKMHKRVIFSYLQQEGFCENFWQTCQKCTCLVHSNILKKNYLSDQLFFFFLGFWV